MSGEVFVGMGIGDWIWEGRAKKIIHCSVYCSHNSVGNDDRNI